MVLKIFLLIFKMFLTSINKLQVKSIEGWIYKANLLNTSLEIIIKTPKNIKNNKNLLREYLIGTELNKLRHKIPTFIYTFGIFQCNSPMKMEK